MAAERTRQTDHLAQTAETVLGVSVSPQEVAGLELPESTIRDFACVAVASAVRRYFGKKLSLDEPIELREGDIAQLREDPELQKLAGQVAAANDTLANWASPPPMPVGADSPDTVRSRFQARAVRALVGHSQQAPSSAEHSLRDGLLFNAPPGSGKSLLQAVTMNYAGVGQPISPHDTRRRTAIGIVRNTELIDQALDPSETLQQFITIGGRDIRTGAFYEKRKDGHDEFDVIYTTASSYQKAVESGAINLDTTVRIVLDEAHRIGMAPSMQERVAEFGPSLYMFTATPAIAGGRRDLRRQYPHIEFGSFREFIEDGILSPMQLYSYRAGLEYNASSRMAITQAIDLVKSGRKTMVVCQPGDQLRQARDVAKEINRRLKNSEFTPHPSFNWEGDEIASAIGKFPGNTTANDIKRMRSGQRLILTTVATGMEGLNIPDLKGLVVIGPQGEDAAWMIEQWLGRISRLTGQMAVAAEIQPASLRPGKRLASILGPFVGDGSLVTPGYHVGPVVPGEVADPEPRATRLTPPLLQGELHSASLPLASLSSAPAPQSYSPPESLHGSLIKGVPLREVLIAPEDLAKLPPEKYKTLQQLAAQGSITIPDGVPVEWLYNELDRTQEEQRDRLAAGQEIPEEDIIHYVGTWERNEDGEMEYVRYYSKAGQEYYANNPIPELADDAEFLDEDIARILGVSRNYVRNTIARLGIDRLDRIVKYHRSPNYYSVEALVAVAQEVARIPLADETDVPVGDLRKETSSSFVDYWLAKRRVDSEYKRRHPAHGVTGFANHITQAAADRMRAYYKSIEVADPATKMSLSDIASLAGASLSTVHVKLDAVQEAGEYATQVQWLRSAPTHRPGEFVDREWGKAFAEVIKPEKLLPWETTLDMVAKYFGKSRQNIKNIISRRDGMPDLIRIPLPGVSETVVYPMSIIIALKQSGLKPAPGVPEVSEHLVALRPEDVGTPGRVRYSQSVQHHFISPEQVVDFDEIGYYYGRRVSPPQLIKKDHKAELATTTTQPPTVSEQPDKAVDDGPVPTKETLFMEPAVVGVRASEAEPETSPNTQPDDTFIKFETLCKQLGCAPHVLNYLLWRERLEGSVASGADGMDIVSGLASAELQEVINNITAPPTGLTSVNTAAAAMGGEVSLGLFTASLMELTAEGELTEDDVCLGRVGNTVDLYVTRNARVKIRRIMGIGM